MCADVRIDILLWEIRYDVHRATHHWSRRWRRHRRRSSCSSSPPPLSAQTHANGRDGIVHSRNITSRNPRLPSRHLRNQQPTLLPNGLLGKLHRFPIPPLHHLKAMANPPRHANHPLRPPNSLLNFHPP